MTSDALPRAPQSRPILFSAPMVRAILAGRKTQTRRVVKRTVQGSPYREDWVKLPGAVGYHTPPCPYGRPDDELWVRETWCEAHPLRFQEGRIGLRLLDAGIPGPPKVDYLVAYRADGELLPIWYSIEHPFRARAPREDWEREIYPKGCETGWIPSIFMPRRASRITLRITGTRVERLQAISDDDAVAEGATPALYRDLRRPADYFRDLWESINGRESWAANPWVWVVDFERVEVQRTAA